MLTMVPVKPRIRRKTGVRPPTMIGLPLSVVMAQIPLFSLVVTFTVPQTRILASPPSGISAMVCKSSFACAKVFAGFFGLQP